MKSPQELAKEAIEQSERATPGPWRWVAWSDNPERIDTLEGPMDAQTNEGLRRVKVPPCVLAIDEPLDNDADAEWIASARSREPELARAVLALGVENAELRRAGENAALLLQWIRLDPFLVYVKTDEWVVRVEGDFAGRLDDAGLPAMTDFQRGRLREILTAHTHVDHADRDEGHESCALCLSFAREERDALQARMASGSTQ